MKIKPVEDLPCGLMVILFDARIIVWVVYFPDMKCRRLLQDAMIPHMMGFRI